MADQRGRPPHTYPRSAVVAPLFGERFLRRYLHDQPHLPRQSKEAVAAHPERSGWGVAREPRYFLLFAQCTPAPRRPRYVAAVLAAQRVRPRDELPMLLAHLTVVTRDEFADVLEYTPRELWAAHLGTWALPRVADGGGGGGGGGEGGASAPCEMLRALLEAMAATHRVAADDDTPASSPPPDPLALPPLLCPLLTSLITSEEAREVILPDAAARQLLGSRLPVAGELASDAARKLRVTFHRHAWRAGARWGVDELRRSCNLTAKAPLGLAEVKELGVDVASYQLLIEVAPAHERPRMVLREAWMKPRWSGLERGPAERSRRPGPLPEPFHSFLVFA